MVEIRDLGEFRIRARELERERGPGCRGAGDGRSDERLLLRVHQTVPPSSGRATDVFLLVLYSSPADAILNAKICAR